MQVSLSAYRDEHGEVVDDIRATGSSIERLVVLRNTDGTLTVRGVTDGDEQFEQDFELSKRKYTGITPIDESPIHTLDDDVERMLETVGFHVESTATDVVKSVDDDSDSTDVET